MPARPPRNGATVWRGCVGCGRWPARRCTCTRRDPRPAARQAWTEHVLDRRGNCWSRSDRIAASPFLSEDHRNVWARLRWQDVRTSKGRVLRLMREAIVDLDNDALGDVGGVDLVFDVLGGDIAKRSACVIRAGGALVTIY